MNSEHPLDAIPTTFWDTIALARESKERFADYLSNMSREELLEFIWTFEETAAEFKYDPYTDYVSERLSQDGIDDLAQWIVERGRDYVYSTFDNPASMPKRANHPDGFLSKAVRTFYRRYGGPVPLRPE